MDSDSNIHVPIEKHEKNVAVYNLKENLMNQCHLVNALDTSRDTDSVPCDIVDVSWLNEEKLKIAKAAVDLEDSTPNLIMTEAELFLDLYKMLLQENKQVKDIPRDIQQSVLEKTSKMKDYFDLITKNQECFQASETSNLEKVNIDLLLKKSMEKMRETRNNFHKVLETCFQDSGTVHLIQDLTFAYFQGGDNKYINLAENTNQYSLTDLNILKEYNIITEDPYDPNKIKISDIVNL